MSSIPFTVYDFFGYIASGLIALSLPDIVAGQVPLADEDLTSFQIILLVLMAYIVGHILASMTKLIYERMLVERLLGLPSKVLFTNPSTQGIKRFLFPIYFKPLDEVIAARVLARAATFGVSGPGDALFYHARTLAKQDASTWSRMEAYLSLYGFCRNISFTLAIASMFFLLLYIDGRASMATWCLLALLSSFIMGSRYLKFYRLYVFELFTSYADIPVKSAGV